MLATTQKTHDMYDFSHLTWIFFGFSHLLFVGPLVLSKDCNVKRLRLVPISNHQTSKFSLFELKLNFFCGCFGFGDFKVDKDPQRVGDLKIPPQFQFQIIKHLNLAFLNSNSNFFVDILDLGILRWIRTPQRVGDL
jgi:hypothetical protein